eukprot:CAMPEP_0183814722 /NCGR_PEP_ID=MMETSP0803_2-20130417/55522_1 /TAXON_ID=195967 /ORGANISM="Crustomastix stigmata, Strain CCMP3273" /LENGTH=245 /DNA_ID=CAMNT_0026059589 /DNA_START=8 /DNA_END=742 /DNA_ORIENTATION=-
MSGEGEEAPAAAPEAAPAVPAFGSAAFGTGGFGATPGGFGFGTGSFGTAPPVFGGAPASGDGDAGGEDGAEGGAEAECTATFKPVVELEEVATSTGEEDEDVAWECKAKLYRFVNDKGEWQERGTGTAKLLKHKENGRVRLLMRRKQTLKICANFYTVPGINLTPHAGSDKAWVFSCMDASDDEPAMTLFAIRFPTSDNAEEFKAEMAKATEQMGEIMEKEGVAGAAEGGGEEAAAEAEEGTSKE